MSTCILPTKSGAFVLATQLEVDRRDLPPNPFQPPGVEAYQLPPTAYRSHKAVFTSLEGLLFALPPVLAAQPNEWDFSKSNVGLVGSMPIGPGTEFVFVRKVDDGSFLLESSVKPKRKKGSLLTITESVFPEGRKVYEIQGKGLSLNLNEALQTDFYAFKTVDKVVAFLLEHLK